MADAGVSGGRSKYPASDCTAVSDAVLPYALAAAECAGTGVAAFIGIGSWDGYETAWWRYAAETALLPMRFAGLHSGAENELAFYGDAS